MVPPPPGGQAKNFVPFNLSLCILRWRSGLGLILTRQGGARPGQARPGGGSDPRRLGLREQGSRWERKTWKVRPGWRREIGVLEAGAAQTKRRLCGRKRHLGTIGGGGADWRWQEPSWKTHRRRLQWGKCFEAQLESASALQGGSHV